MPIDSKRKRLRVALIHYRDAADAGGSLRVGEAIANNLDPARISAEIVFAYGGPGPVTQHAKVPCHFIGSKGPKDFPAAVRARNLFAKLRPDIIHFQDAVVWLRAALAGTPCLKVVHIHGRYEKRDERVTQAGRDYKHPFEATTLLRNFLRFTDAQVCISSGARNSLLNLGWITAEKSFVVYNAVDVSRFRARLDQSTARLSLGLPRDAFLLGMVGRLVPAKGYADFFEIIERLPRRWHGVICGDGPQKLELQRMCEARGLSGRVHFIGCQNETVPVYAALDAYMFLSRYEPFGLVMAEAIASHLPVFGIESDGEFNEAEYPLLRRGANELLPFLRAGNYQMPISPDLLDQLVSKISDYGEHPEAYRHRTAEAHTWVANCFDAAVQAEAMTRVYENILSGSLSQETLADWYRTTRERAESLVASAGELKHVTANA